MIRRRGGLVGWGAVKSLGRYGSSRLNRGVGSLGRSPRSRERASDFLWIILFFHDKLVASQRSTLMILAEAITYMLYKTTPATDGRDKLDSAATMARLTERSFVERRR